jgi:methylenetetrahydrofolate reductase (NADPH)
VRIDELLKAGPTRSFEFFPPKSDDEAAVLDHTLGDLEPLAPSFVSVTYRGGPASRQRTFDLVSRIQREHRLVAMAHLICVGHSEAELREILVNYQTNDVVNLMALGGDRPEDPAAVHGEFEYAIELVQLARELGGFSIGVAAHPLGHPRSRDLRSDRIQLARKLELADFAVTQFFFHFEEWSRLVDELAALGNAKPVLPGVIPVTTLSGIPRLATMGAAVPHALVERLELANESGGPAAVRAEGIMAATEMCRELLDAGAPGLHFYTLNRSTATREIHANLFGA